MRVRSLSGVRPWALRAVLPALLFAGCGGGPDSGEGTSRAATLRLMQEIAKSLAVDCDYCHTTDPPKATALNAKGEVARRDIRETHTGQGVACTYCHASPSEITRELPTGMTMAAHFRQVGAAGATECSACHAKGSKFERYTEAGEHFRKTGALPAAAPAAPPAPAAK